MEQTTIEARIAVLEAEIALLKLHIVSRPVPTTIGWPPMYPTSPIGYPGLPTTITCGLSAPTSYTGTAK